MEKIRTEHGCKCRRMFDEIQNGEKIYISVDREIPEDPMRDGYGGGLLAGETEYVRISLLSDEMLDYDAGVFEDRSNRPFLDEYRPYFASFIVPLDGKNWENVRSLGSGWHVGRFAGSEGTADAPGIFLDGILETSASPVCYLEKRLLVFRDRTVSQALLNQISSTYNPRNFAVKSSQEIEKILQTAWGGDFPQTIDIYNVGHGNADCIWGVKHKILYDVGYSYRSLPKPGIGKFQKAAAALRMLKPDCVILSHWDTDHMIGCAYAGQDLFHKKWVAPYLVSDSDHKASPNSVRLAQYLQILDSLCLVDRDQSNKLIAVIPCGNDVEMKVWLGSGASRLTAKNREGLMIEITDRNSVYPNVLLAGDVPYRCMPDQVLRTHFDFIHVPHHCSAMELDRLKTMSVGTCAVISANRNGKGTLNCDDGHYSELQKKFAVAAATIENPLGDDSKNLSIEIRYTKSKKTWRLR